MTNGIYKTPTHRPGAALLIVLIIIMAITVLGMGFVSRSDVELASGNNMLLRSQMDTLVESALEHARGILFSPYDVDTGLSDYWTGDNGIQLTTGNDYYDIDIDREISGYAPRTQYDISVTAYRLSGADTLGTSSLNATLRLDPCIAVWSGVYLSPGSGVVINGDVYSANSTANYGTIRGDVFAARYIYNYNSIIGSSNTWTSAPVGFSGIDYTDFQTSYKYNGSSTYSVDTITPGTKNGQTYTSAGSNPAGVYYCNGDLTLDTGNTFDDAMLVVNGDLTIEGSSNTIQAHKNFPALVVNGELIFKDSAQLTIYGLAQIKDDVYTDPSATNVDFDVIGALYMSSGEFDNSSSSNGSYTITAAPMLSAIRIWPNSTSPDPYQFTTAANAYFKRVQR